MVKSNFKEQGKQELIINRIHFTDVVFSAREGKFPDDKAFKVVEISL